MTFSRSVLVNCSKGGNMQSKCKRFRIRWNTKLIAPKHIIITFRTNNLPESMKTSYCKHRMRPYIPLPQCFVKCQRFVNGYQGCRGCGACAKCAYIEHLSDSYNSAARCVSSEGDRAYSRTSPSWKKEEEIKELKVNLKQRK